MRNDIPYFRLNKLNAIIWMKRTLKQWLPLTAFIQSHEVELPMAKSSGIGSSY